MKSRDAQLFSRLDLKARSGRPHHVKIGKRRRKLLYKKQRGYCMICGDWVPKKQATIDHIMPKSLGGSNKLRNLRMTCGPCNWQKGENLPSGEIHPKELW